MDITSHMDAVYWGVLVSTMLMGITMCQGWIYANNNNDKWHLRLLVAVLILMDFAVTFLSCSDLHQHLISDFGNSVALYMILPVNVATTILTGIVAYLSELFFASRIYILDKSSTWAAAIAGLSATVSFVFLMLPMNALQREPWFSTLSSSDTKLYIGISLAFTVVAVTTVTAVLLMKLSSAHTSIKITRKILQRLHLFIVTRGLLVMLNAIVYLLVFEIQPHTLYWLPFLYFSSKLHVISMVSMLNARTCSAEGSIISVVNGQDSDQAFNLFMRNSVANDSKSHSLH
ncbi:hypothetical protein L208DRAFT_1391252 [Tricholoma matsutake]|nr:hypothetical protein L208DRAFT_1391252 [Tricholoma matsutake 945]